MIPPATCHDLLDALRRHHDRLSPRLRQVARHIIEHPTQAALMTVTALGSEAGAPPSALVRLSKALGFAGFSDMQRVLQTALAAGAPSYGERVQQLRSDAQAAGAAGLLGQASSLGQLSLQNLVDTVQPAALDEAVALLAGAPLIHVMGQRRSHPVAGYIAYGLTRSGKVTRLLAGTAGMLRDEAVTMRPGDALVVVSQPPYSAETIETTEWANANGVGVVALSDGTLSPFATRATVMLDVRDSELHGFRALTAQMCLAQVLVLGVLQATSRARNRTRPGAKSKERG